MSDALVESIDFEGLRITFDARVLRPRPWTAGQSNWAARLLADLPAGPVLELCCGAGHIGLAAITRNDRHLVCVDADPVAAEFARNNAQAAGLADRVEQRLGLMDDVLLPGETFPLILADPPWVVSDEVNRYPEDPPFAIDGGPEGLHVARRCWRVIEHHLHQDGQALLQLGTVDQVAALVSMGDGSLRCVETRQFEGGVVARLVHAP
jgi:methylase of polypeptide subunit release factors